LKDLHRFTFESNNQINNAFTEILRLPGVRPAGLVNDARLSIFPSMRAGWYPPPALRSISNRV
jgi:hypothetical protein